MGTARLNTCFLAGDLVLCECSWRAALVLQRRSRSWKSITWRMAIATATITTARMAGQRTRRQRACVAAPAASGRAPQSGRRGVRKRLLSLPADCLGAVATWAGLTVPALLPYTSFLFCSEAGGPGLEPLQRRPAYPAAGGALLHLVPGPSDRPDAHFHAHVSCICGRHCFLPYEPVHNVSVGTAPVSLGSAGEDQ